MGTLGEGFADGFLFEGGVGVAVAEALEEVGAKEFTEGAVAFVLGGVDEFVGHDVGLGGEVAAQEDAVAEAEAADVAAVESPTGGEAVHDGEAGHGDFFDGEDADFLRVADADADGGGPFAREEGATVAEGAALGAPCPPCDPWHGEVDEGGEEPSAPSGCK